MNVLKFLSDYGIPHVTEGHPRCSKNHVNTHCPFCPGGNDYHLGFELSGKYANCWQCGWHPISKTISKLIGVSESEARKILNDYGGKFFKKTKEIKRRVRKKSHKFPSGTTALTKRHFKYLEKRNFNPKKITYEWSLFGTGPIAKLDNIDYKFRIIAPIFWNNEQVSFQARDITGNHKVKYLACPKERELIEHKHILYGDQNYWDDIGICVEGITDVWRLGKKSFATFGIKFTHKQIRIMSKNFKRIFIIFDDEPQAQRQAKKLQKELLFRNIEAIIQTIDGDPGDLTDKDAKELIKKIY